MGRKALDFSNKVDPRTGLMVVDGVLLNYYSSTVVSVLTASRKDTINKKMVKERVRILEQKPLSETDNRKKLDILIQKKQNQGTTVTITSPEGIDIIEAINWIDPYKMVDILKSKELLDLFSIRYTCSHTGENVFSTPREALHQLWFSNN